MSDSQLDLINLYLFNNKEDIVVFFSLKSVNFWKIPVLLFTKIRKLLL